MSITEAQVTSNNLPDKLVIGNTKFSSFNELIDITRHVFQFVTNRTGLIMHLQPWYFSEIFKILEKDLSVKIN